MTIIDFVRDQLRQAHEFLEMTMSDVTPEQAAAAPGGKANPLGAAYAHLVTGEDAFVHGFLQGGAPLFAGEWAARTGLSEPPPPDTEWQAWGARVRVDLPAVREYARAVYAASDAYLAGLKDADLERKLDLSAVGLGEQTLGWVLGAGVVGHVQAHWGEICCLKGIQGGQGFPV